MGRLASIGVAAALLVGFATAASAHSIRYVLMPGSVLRIGCQTCARPLETIAPLSGSFALTVMPIPNASVIEAVTEVSWRGGATKIVGAGFLQRAGHDAITMVLDARIDDRPVVLASVAHPTRAGSELYIILTSSSDVDGKS